MQSALDMFMSMRYTNLRFIIIIIIIIISMQYTQTKKGAVTGVSLCDLVA